MTILPRGLKRVLLFGVLPLLLAGAALAWVERHELLRMYWLHRLENSCGDEARTWAAKLAPMGDEVAADVLALLHRDDADLCDNARLVLAEMLEQSSDDGPRCADLLHRMIKEFPRSSDAGKQVILSLAAERLEASADCPSCLVCACGRVLIEAGRGRNAALQEQAVAPAIVVAQRTKEADLLCGLRELTTVALRSQDLDTRLRAVKLAMQPGIDMRKETLPLLDDPAPLVRRAVLLAVGENPEIISTDRLLYWLHDPDADVRRSCEDALKSEARGNLSPEFIRMGKRVTDPDWQVRLGVLDRLDEAEGLDPRVWLDRLSHDVSPAVRAAAVRAATENADVDLSGRIGQMAQADPSPTVASLARHYLTRRKKTPRE